MKGTTQMPGGPTTIIPVSVYKKCKECKKLKDKLKKERNNEFLQFLHSERQPIFKSQLERTEERRQAATSESEALANYKEKRAIPKKVNRKSNKGPNKSKDSAKPKGKAKAKSKSADSETEGTVGTDGEAPAPETKGGKKGDKALDPEKVLDAVEAKMRKEMEEQRKRDMKDKKRTKKIKEKVEAWVGREDEHNAEVREHYRQNVTEKEQTAAERRLVMQNRQSEVEAAEERKKAERARLERVRQQNIAKREQARLERLCA